MYCVGVSDVIPMWMAGGQGAEHGKNLARNMLAFQKKYDKTKQYKYQGQRVVDTRHADLKGQRGSQHIGCEHDV